MDADIAVRCQGLGKRYGNVVALDDLNLTIPTGTIFGFLGPNGAGKTTTIRLLTGLEKPTAGTASVAGIDVIDGDSRLHEHIGYLDQHPQFYNWMTGRELVEFVGRLYGMRGISLRTRVKEVLGQVGLSGAANRRIAGYSGGMRQRLGLAQALVNRSQVLFLDEPASALDPAGRRDVLDIIAGLRGQATVFMSTHILSDVERICDLVAIVNKGRLVVESSLDGLQAEYAQPVFVLDPEPRQKQQVSVLIEALRRQPWANGVTVAQGEIRLVASDPTAAGREILKVVAQSEVVLARMERVRPSLEDIFLRLVGDERGVQETTT